MRVQRDLQLCVACHTIHWKNWDWEDVGELDCDKVGHTAHWKDWDCNKFNYTAQWKDWDWEDTGEDRLR